ncbi:peroxisomal acetoacetyl-coenzyme A thiolase [Dunaliella salina]|uniref:Peroxisomal acetoacetyl-coenzyme A thiolase n=1 Tax=Dunaliella salina TaxID=3046 RepID=A0ABQ7GQG0_DUNSA|nr:peroxisomal acetoacetyl-coenzyme A thiolase [Dunaliella salina]|eukprot:KAF5836844.1 peroxisomal acetoacetyl-coenzyme A thiolase [Dunaliella salina]
MKAVMLADLCIRTGLNDIVVAGGMESMSNAPYYAPKVRSGLRIGDAPLVDGMIKDGLWDPYSNVHMGQCGELCASRYGISREQQDDHAVESHARARLAMAQGWTAREITPIRVGDAVVENDEGPAKFNMEKLRRLRPAFQAEGTVTAGNASPLTDGAAALVISSRKAAQECGLPVLAVIRSQADANQAPEWFTTSPAVAAPKAVARAGLEMKDIDAWEINEAFSVVDLACSQLMHLDRSKVNMHGGAVALGHPIGASGARLLVTLINVLQVHCGKYGCAAVCNGGGGASSMVIEMCGSQPARL